MSLNKLRHTVKYPLNSRLTIAGAQVKIKININLPPILLVLFSSLIPVSTQSQPLCDIETMYW